MWGCKKCGESGGIWKLLRIVGKLHLLHFAKSVEWNRALSSNLLARAPEEVVVKQEIPNKTLPLGWKRIWESEYLEERGWSEEEYFHYPVGEAKILSSYRNYLIFPIYQEKECKGFVARSSYSKEETKSLKEQGIEILRYNNSKHTDFALLVYGLDELTHETHTVIVVEGLFDKINVDRILNLFRNCGIKCVCTFGKKISSYQTFIIKHKAPNIHTLILFYDSGDAVRDLKKYSALLQREFPCVLVAHTTARNEKGEIKDPGELNKEEIDKVFETLQTPEQFYFTKIGKRIK